MFTFVFLAEETTEFVLMQSNQPKALAIEYTFTEKYAHTFGLLLKLSSWNNQIWWNQAHHKPTFSGTTSIISYSAKSHLHFPTSRLETIIWILASYPYSYTVTFWPYGFRFIEIKWSCRNWCLSPSIIPSTMVHSIKAPNFYIWEAQWHRSKQVRQQIYA